MCHDQISIQIAFKRNKRSMDLDALLDQQLIEWGKKVKTYKTASPFLSIITRFWVWPSLKTSAPIDQEWPWTLQRQRYQYKLKQLY